MKEVASHTPLTFRGIALDAKCKCGHQWGHHQMVEPHKCIIGKQEEGCGCAAFRPVGLRTTPLRAAIKSMAVEGELEALQSAVDKACGEIDTLRASNRELLAALEAVLPHLPDRNDALNYAATNDGRVGSVHVVAEQVRRAIANARGEK